MSESTSPANDSLGTSPAAPSAQRKEPSFRANPDRAVFIQGAIDQALIDRLSPDIIRLHHQSRESITVYIDSPGGRTDSAASLIRLLGYPTQDSRQRCPLITVVTLRAWSAAADFLCSGNYAIAYPGSTIHFHGVRTHRENPLTIEDVSGITRDLRRTNDQFATELAKKCSKRIFFRYVTLRSKFAEYQEKQPEPISPKDCFIGLVTEKLSPLGIQALNKAVRRVKRYDSLAGKIMNTPSISKRVGEMQAGNLDNFPQFEAQIIKAIVSFELATKNVTDGTSAARAYRRSWTTSCSSMNTLASTKMNGSRISANSGAVSS
jgi:ATP-dependent protease ClpP protease subunit